MDQPPAGLPDISGLLGRWKQGDKEASAEMLPLVYDHLRRIANQMMRGERAGHTLSATALVHEAWFRLRDTELAPEDRNHFIAVAARQMRRVLVDHARTKLREKRGGGDWQRISFTGLGAAGNDELPLDHLVALNSAFEKLGEFDPRKAEVADMFLFGGLTIEEVAEVVGLSTATINRDWAFARGFLRKELGL